MHLINGFNKEQAAGQRLMVGFEGRRFNPDLRRLIADFKVGGVILFAGNIAAPEQLKTLCRDIQAFARHCGQPPLFIAVDQEGGPVARLKHPFSEFAGNAAMADEKEAADFAAITAAELRSVGINMNMAPVLDVAPSGVDSVMARRSFGGDPQRVARMGCVVVDRLQRGGIMSVAKHFPGIGRTTLDSHLDQPVLNIPADELKATDLVPFKAAFEKNVAGIMLSHIRYSALDEDWPASLSPQIADDFLRRRMGYEGVVLTDDLDMGAVTKHYSVETVVDRICRARVDIALICHKGPAIAAALAAFKKHLQTDPAAAAAGRRSLDRIMALKRAYLD